MASHPELRDIVDLWVVDLSGAEGALERAAKLLDAVECARAQRIVMPVVRDRFVLARAALRTILGHYLQIPPRRVVLREGAAGKPHLDPPADLAFNLSHTRDLAVLAVTAREQVGVDVELLGRTVASSVMRRVLDERELALVLAAPAERRDELFLRHWTAKEAYVKALGIGLAAGLRGVGVREATTTPTIAGAWSVQRFDPRPGAVGAVAVAGGPWVARRRELASAGALSL